MANPENFHSRGNKKTAARAEYVVAEKTSGAYGASGAKVGLRGGAREPNATSIAALQELERGGGKRFANVADMWADFEK